MAKYLPIQWSLLSLDIFCVLWVLCCSVHCLDWCQRIYTFTTTRLFYTLSSYHQLRLVFQILDTILATCQPGGTRKIMVHHSGPSGIPWLTWERDNHPSTLSPRMLSRVKTTSPSWSISMTRPTSESSTLAPAGGWTSPLMEPTWAVVLYRATTRFLSFNMLWNINCRYIKGGERGV